ncbi:hypothetical protein MHYP_G00285020 [Metynnis hypsauchen]
MCDGEPLEPQAWSLQRREIYTTLAKKKYSASEGSDCREAELPSGLFYDRGLSICLQPAEQSQ